MKSLTRCFPNNARIFTSLFISFIILVTPIAPVFAAQMRQASYLKSSYKSSAGVQPGVPLSPPATTVLTATKTDSFPDPNNDGKAEEGDTITYDVNLSNTGGADATGVTFTDTIDSNTTLVPGSLKVSPLAFADTYNATKDVPLSIGAPGVLSNDTGTPAPSAQTITSGATAQGGTVTLNADGSFSYTPASGFTGTDSFSYTVTNGLTPNDTATVTINVDEGPTVTNTTPANGTINIAPNTNITVNFSESVNATTGSFSIECPGGSPQAFSLSASPSASFTLDPVADLPAGTTCTVTVIATQITDADTFDPPDQMAANYVFSFGVKPDAVDDMHSVTGNVRINTASSGYSVLTNDSGGAPITAFDATSVHGGNVTMNTGTGTFTYDPPRGFTGTDSFTYTVSNANGSDTGTVVLTVSDMVWFINNSAAACVAASCGRLTSPYNSLGDFEAVNGNGTVLGGAVVDPEAGDHIFIYTGGGSYTGPLTLENNQRVIGQGSSSSIETLAGITLAPDSDALPSTGGTNPTITNPTDGGIILAQNNNIHGLTISDTSGIGLSGNNFGTLTVSENVVLSNTATAGTPVNLNNGVLNATFRSISAGNNNANPDPVNGIVLSNTTGSFTVAGNGGACTIATPTCTGGTIRSTTGDGVSLTSAQNVSLSFVQILDTGRHGISGSNVNGFTFKNSLNVGAGDADEENGIIFGNDNISLGPIANGVFGKVLIEDAVIDSPIQWGLRVFNNAVGNTLDMTLRRLTVQNNINTFGEDAVSMNITGGTANVLVDDCKFLNTDGSGVSGFSQGISSPSLNLTVQNSTFNENRQLPHAINFVTASAGVGKLKATGNTMVGCAVAANCSRAIDIDAAGTSTLDAIVNNNTSTNNGIGGFLEFISNDNAIGRAEIRNNNATVNSNRIGMNFQARAVSTPGSTGQLHLTLDNNTISGIDGAFLPAFAFQSGASGGTHAQTLCVNLSTAQSAGNNVINGITGSDVYAFTLRQRTGTTFRLQGFAGTGTSDSSVEGFVNTNNTGGTLGPAPAGSSAPGSRTEVFAASGSTIVNYTAGTCQTPTAPPLPVAMLNLENGQQPAFAQADGAIPVDATAQSVSMVLGESLSNLGNDAATGVDLAHNRSSLRQTRNNAALSAKTAAVLNPAPSGETVTANIGTLPAGKSVRVQFQVTVNNSLPSNVTQVSNQGTVSGDNFASVLTDDPAAGGSADPTVTPILTPPDIRVNDASVAEPSSGSAPAAFTVTLSHAFSQAITVSYTTANGGANPATAGADYTTSSGTVTFNPGETVQTISVPVLADGDNSETAETFLVNISGASAGVITDSQATGTINPNGTPGTVLISELRTSGPAGADDDFVEILNNTDSDITVQASDASAGWALVKSGSACSDTPVVIAVIPNGTVIPARGNYLLTGSAYSLVAYSAGDQPLTANIEDDRNVALFSTADLSNLQTGTRLDGVGFGGNSGNNCDLLREGANLQPASGSLSEYSFVRKVSKGETIDAGDNATDFVVVSTTPGTAVGSNATPTLGAPGPENSTSPRGPVPCNAPGTAKFDRARLDSSVSVGSAPNTVRDTTSDSLNNSTYGTLDVRRRFTNNTGGSVTRLRFRIVDMSTTPSPSGTADLRARTSTATLVTGVNDAVTCNGSAPCNVTVEGTTLETPPLQALGGGVNSKLGAGTITLGTPLNNGSSINLRLLFGVQQEGDYHIGIVLETLTSGSIGQDIWELRGNTQTGGHTDGGCNTPPVANAGADQTVECAGGLTPVTLDGTASTDPDGDTPLTYEWREGVTVLGTGATLNTSFAFGSHTITLKVTDPSGDFSEDTVTVNVVDTSDPMITAPPNVSVSTGPGATTCGTVVTDAQLGNATASDGCSASVTVTRTGVPSGNVFPVGQTFITYTADDGHGHTKSVMQTVTVTDNTPPTLSVPPDQTVNAPANSCSANVNPGTATGNDNCPGVTITGVRSDSQALNAPYPVGTTTITWTAKDASNNTTTGVQTIKVKDATAPTIVLTSNTISLSPPNHQYHTFTIAQLVASVSDLCDAGVDLSDVVISQVTSDEPEDANGNGDGNTQDDIVITPDCKSLQVRSERSGNGNGRVYTVTLQVKDSSGNVATATRKIFVPNSGPVVDSGVQYTVNGCTP
jgi:uncharacterized repeat protein (TIGR01451 family)